MIKSLDQVKREHIVEVLIECNWNVKKAAFYLKVAERSIRNFLYKNPDIKLPKKSQIKKK